MAIIKYQLVNSTTPSGITEGGHYKVGDDFIGIGSGVGTELSKSELLDYVLAEHRANPVNYKFSYSDGNPDGSVSGSSPNKTTDEVIAEINEWCTHRGIS